MNSDESFLGKLWHSVKTFFTGASSVVHTIITVADKIVNEFKTVEESTVGQFLETTLETLIPQTIPLVNALKLWLPKIVTDLNWAVAEDGKKGEEVLADALKYLNTLKGVNIDAYAAQLNTLNALIQKFMSDNQQGGLTIQQAITVGQVIHNPDLIATAE